MQKITDALAEYIKVVSDSLNETSHAADRLCYVKHLAEAAVIFSLVHRGASCGEVEAKVRQEQRIYGRGYLSGSEGAAAEAAFAALALIVMG